MTNTKPGRDKLVSRLFLFSILLFGAIIFALPFLDMFFTSMKLDDEMSTENYHLLPKPPHAQWQSPYVLKDSEDRITRPPDMPRSTWDEFSAPFTTTVRQRIAAWWDSYDMIADHMPKVSRDEALDTLTQTVGARVLARLSDTSRKASVSAMLQEAAALTTPDTILPEFRTCVPHFAVGDVRVRMTDFSLRRAGGFSDWHLGSGGTPGTQLSTTENQPEWGTQATFHFLRPSDRAEFFLTLHSTDHASAPAPAPITTSGLPPLGKLDRDTASHIDRVYVPYLPDRSWCKIEVFVTRNNIVYQMKEPLYSDDFRWNELELHWPDPDQDALAGRSYRLLEPVSASGPPQEISAQTVPFAVRIVLTPSSAPNAWYAKATRNYSTAFQQVPITRYIMTSVSLAILNIVLVVFASSFAAYAFARLNFPGRDLLFGVLLATMMIPGQVTMIPTFLIYKNLGLYNTLLPLWAPSAFGTAFFIFMARQFLKNIPKELEEAARIDGCGFFRIYLYIMLPLIRPTLAAIAMFSFQGVWNNFMGPLIYLNDERLFNLAFGLFKFQTLAGDRHTLLMASAFVMTLPLIITFFLFQRYFIQGVALSGLGGR